MKKTKAKIWMTTPKELTKWKKNQGVFFLSGQLAQVVIIDLNDPIGVLIQKPLRISKESGTITGVFSLNNMLVKQAKKKGYDLKEIFVVAAYNREAKSFVYTVSGEQLPLVLNNPEVRYIGGEERSTAKIRLGMTDE